MTFSVFRPARAGGFFGGIPCVAFVESQFCWLDGCISTQYCMGDSFPPGKRGKVALRWFWRRGGGGTPCTAAVMQINRLWHRLMEIYQISNLQVRKHVLRWSSNYWQQLIQKNCNFLYKLFWCRILSFWMFSFLSETAAEDVVHAVYDELWRASYSKRSALAQQMLLM